MNSVRASFSEAARFFDCSSLFSVKASLLFLNLNDNKLHLKSRTRKHLRLLWLVVGKLLPNNNSGIKDNSVNMHLFRDPHPWSVSLYTVCSVSLRLWSLILTHNKQRNFDVQSTLLNSTGFFSADSFEFYSFVLLRAFLHDRAGKRFVSLVLSCTGKISRFESRDLHYILGE